MPRWNAALASDSVTKFWEKVQNHPEMTDEELTAAYKVRGEIILDELEHILIHLMCVPAAEPALPGS